ncbi:MAG: ATP-dependent Clp protease ATP-binding subunit [Ruminococcaceae bacterium]|nr:ATP-dependent Clp protease ATP-binding subunit [Oscillospiraceae bacterium]
MKMKLCSRCKKNIAVVFLTKIENGQVINEGLCLKCARQLGIRQVQDVMDNMGITEDDLESMEAMTEQAGLPIEGDDGALEIPMEHPEHDAPDAPEGGTASFPFVQNIFGGAPQGEHNAPPPPKGGRRDQQKKKFLEMYCTHLTGAAREGKLDRVIGREQEIARMIQILNRRQKNNPCLIGEPGVGKTAVAEGLAVRIVSKDVPAKLLDKEIYLLDLTALVAGTQFRGQFESRIKGLIEEIKKLGNIILVIDEVHNLMAAGDAEGAMNAANILKPALSRGEIQVIGATTFAEYRKHIEKDAALERRFQPVIINEPSKADAVEILRGIRPYYEEFHAVRISDEITSLAVELSERYIYDRFLPDKAIDLIDEAASSLNLQNTALIERVKLEDELKVNDAEREALMSDSSIDAYARLAELRSSDLRIRQRLTEIDASPIPELKLEDLARVIELWTHIPASRVAEAEYARLSGMATRLRQRIKGQDAAIDTVVAAILRNRVGLAAKRKPVSFIFTGPTGVGKTELVKQLAQDMFDAPEALIRLDMSEFMEKHSVSRIIGAPPGYVGYDEAGQLTERIRRRPYCVILFDEIEKAHPDVLNILLQILDDGRITDAHGRAVNFENTIIIMTSNAGSERTETALGFGRTVSEQGRDKAMKALSDIMRPEFINRIDEIVPFDHLSRENFRDIAVIFMNELRDSLATRGITLTWDDALLDYVTDKSYSVKFGARNLRRVIQKEIEDVAAASLIEAFARDIHTIALSADSERVSVALF